jgi:zinc transport system permease protein
MITTLLTSPTGRFTQLAAAGEPAMPLADGFDWLLEAVYGALLTAMSELTGIDMLGYAYMQRAYLAAICIAIIGPVVGTFLVHRELSMLSDTLAHTAFAGVALGLFLNSVLSLSVSPIITAFVVAIVTALLVELLIDHADTYGDTSLAMVLTGGFAVGSILITATGGGIAVGINAYLFGSLATVSKTDIGLLILMSLIVGAVVTLAYRPLVYVTFDAPAARAARFNVRHYKRLLVVLTAGVVVSAMQIMGVILVAAMLVIPVAAAAPVARSFKQSIWLAIIAGQLATVIGVTVAYQFGIAAGGSIVVTALLVYLGVVAGRRVRREVPLLLSAMLYRYRRRRSPKQVSADGGDERK